MVFYPQFPWVHFPSFYVADIHQQNSNAGLVLGTVSNEHAPLIFMVMLPYSEWLCPNMRLPGFYFYFIFCAH
jgi:hypothetical protein